VAPAGTTEERGTIEEGLKGGDEPVAAITSFEEFLRLDGHRVKAEPLGAGNHFKPLLNVIRHIIEKQCLGAIGRKPATPGIAGQIAAFGIADTDFNVLDFNQRAKSFRGVLKR
jgi:hypothetical protein